MRWISSRVLTFAGILLMTFGGFMSCGGGGGGGGVVDSSCVGFEATGSPASSRVVAREGSTSQCDLVQVELVLTGVADVTSVSFDASFDTAAARYEGYSLSGSLLTGGGVQVQVLEDRLSGSVKLGLTRPNPAAGVDFTAGGTVVRLLFSPAQSSGTASGALAFTNTGIYGSESPPVLKTGIQWIGGTLRLE